MAKAKFPGKLPRHLATNRQRIVTKYVDVKQDAAMLSAMAVAKGWKAYTTVFGSSDEEDNGFEGFPAKVSLNEPRPNDAPEKETPLLLPQPNQTSTNVVVVNPRSPSAAEQHGFLTPQHPMESEQPSPLASTSYFMTDFNKSIMSNMPDTPTSVALSPQSECLMTADNLTREPSVNMPFDMPETPDSLPSSVSQETLKTTLKLLNSPNVGDGKMKRIVARYTASITGSKKGDKEKIRLKMEKLLKAHWAGRIPATHPVERVPIEPPISTMVMTVVPSKPEESASSDERKGANVDSILRKPRLQLNQKLLKQLRAPARLQRFSQQIQEQAPTQAAAPVPVVATKECSIVVEDNTVITVSHPAGCAFVYGGTNSSAVVSPSADDGIKGNPGTVVCGICGVVRKYSFVLQARKFGTFACEPCRKFISRTLRNRLPVTCSKNSGDCILVPTIPWTGKQPFTELAETPDNLPAKFKCKACWLKMALLGFCMKDEDHDALRLLLPQDMHSSVPDAAHRTHFKSDAPHKGEIIKLSRTNHATFRDPKLSTAVVVLEDAKLTDNTKKRKIRVKRGKEETPVTKSAAPVVPPIPVKDKEKNKTQLLTNAPTPPPGNSSRSSCSRGPRIKHVCRSASAVLGPPKATFPTKPVPESPHSDDKSCDGCRRCEKRPKTCEEVMIADKIEANQSSSSSSSQSPVNVIENAVKNSSNSPSGGSMCATPLPEQSGEESQDLKHEKPDKHKLWEQGLCILTTVSRSSYLPQHLCYLCGSAGKDELIMCSSCCETFHPYCMDEKDVLPWVCGRCQPTGSCSTCSLAVTSSPCLQCSDCASWVHESCAGITWEQLQVFTYIEKAFLCSRCFPEGDWSTLWRDLVREFAQLLQVLLPRLQFPDLWQNSVTSLGALHRLLLSGWQGLPEELDKTFETILPFYRALESSVTERLKIADPTEEDTRICVLCPQKGDQSATLEGRLLYIGSDQWIHVNCCVWSQHVVEEEGGALQDLPAALLYAKHTACTRCKQKGASVACSLKPCPIVYHFACAVQAECVFTPSKLLYCPSHATLRPSSLPLSTLAVERPIYVDRSDRIPIGPLHDIQATVGSLRVRHLGSLSAVSDHEQVLVPVQFRCTRRYWSVTRPGTITSYHIITKYVAGSACSTSVVGLETTIDHTQDLDIDSTTLGDIEADAIMCESGLNIPGMESQEDKELIHMVLQDMDFEQELVDSASRYQQHKEDDYSQLALEQLLADPTHAMALLNSLPPEVDPLVKSDLEPKSAAAAGNSASNQAKKEKKLDQNSNVTRVKSPKKPKLVRSRQLVASVKVTTGVPLPLWLEADSTSETDISKLKPILQLDGAMDSDSDVELLSVDRRHCTAPAGDTEPIKCAKCKRFYRTAASFAKHEQSCSFEQSGSDTDEENERIEPTHSVLFTQASVQPPLRLPQPLAPPSLPSVVTKSTPIPIAPAPPEHKSSALAAQSKYVKIARVKPPRKKPAKRNQPPMMTTPLLNTLPMYNPLYLPQGLVMPSGSVSQPMLVLPPPPNPGNNGHAQHFNPSAHAHNVNNGNNGSAPPVLQYLGALPSDMLLPTFTTSLMNFSQPLNNNFLYLSTNTMPYEPAPTPTFTLTPTQGPDGQVTFVLTQTQPPASQPPPLVLNSGPNLSVNMQPYSQNLVIPVNHMPQPQLYLPPPQPPPPPPPTPVLENSPTPLSILPVPVPFPDPAVPRTNIVSQVSPDSASILTPPAVESLLSPETQLPVTPLEERKGSTELEPGVEDGVKNSQTILPTESETEVRSEENSNVTKLEIDEIQDDILQPLFVEAPPPEQENNVSSSTTPLPTYSYRKAMAAQVKKGRVTAPRAITPPVQPVEDGVETGEPTLPVREPDSSEQILISPILSIAPEPQPSVNPLSFSLKTRLSIPDSKKPKTNPVGPHIVYELTSDDGFSLSSSSLVDLWQELVLAVQKARSDHKLSPLSTTVLPGDKAWSLLGLTHNTLQYLLEQLPGASKCVNFKFRHHAPEWEEPGTGPVQGCARAVPYASRSPQDMFGWLASKHRVVPQPIPSAYMEGTTETGNKRFTVDLPLTMRYRQLKESGKEKVGVYRSPIHGRGLFSKRDIEAGEMVIEYAGQLVRSSLTDKREKMYQAKGIGCYMFRIDEQTVVDATVHGNAARFINHSCEPNCYSRIVDIFGKKHILIFALRRILRGEELTYDYKFPIEEDKIPCSCGATKCRKYLN